MICYLMEVITIFNVEILYEEMAYRRRDQAIHSYPHSL